MTSSFDRFPCTAISFSISVAVFRMNLGQTAHQKSSSSSCSGRKPDGISSTGFPRTGCPSCHRTDSVKALKEIQSHDPPVVWPSSFFINYWTPEERLFMATLHSRPHCIVSFGQGSSLLWTHTLRPFDSRPIALTQEGAVWLMMCASVCVTEG